MAEQHPPGPEGAPTPHPTTADVREADAVLRSMQRILNNLNAHRHRESPEFQRVMGYYKHLGTNLHHVRKQVEEDEKATARMARQVALVNKHNNSRPSAIGIKVAPSLLDQARQHHGLPPVQRPAPLARPAPAAPAVAQAAPARADQPAAATPAEAPLPEAPAAPAAPAGPPPLAIPRFEATLGPPGQHGAVAMGEEVGYLQRLLAHLGYQVEESEEYDKATLQAVMDFQETNELEPTGMVGAETRKLLNGYVTG